MKKRFSKALALLLALVMVLSVLPVMALAEVAENSPATFISGLPEDGSYGVIYNADGYVMGFDLDNGKAPAKKVTLTPNQGGIASLPNGTMANTTGNFTQADGRNWAEIGYPVRGWIKGSILGYAW